MAGRDVFTAMMTIPKEIESPGIVIDLDGLERNLHAMQAICDRHGVELWPHIKTHKMVPILRRQLELGAKGATCAKLGEAEAMLPSGVRRIFIAHSLADFSKAARLGRLASQLDELILAVTSECHFEVLERLLGEAGLSLPVLMAVDTGLNREGTRTPEQSARLAEKIRQSSCMTFRGLYTHEGQTYQLTSQEEVSRQADAVYEQMMAHAVAIGGDVLLWPGCSVTAAVMAGKPGVHAVRPGSYVFGDLSLSDGVKIRPFTENALSVLATVVDRPTRELALIDAGSKMFSGDKTAAGLSGRCVEYPGIVVSKVSEEHGFLTGADVARLTPGDRLQFIPAHVCPVVNLASQVYVIAENRLKAIWPVDARGRSD